MCVTVPLHINVLTSCHSTNVMQFEDSHTFYILITYNVDQMEEDNLEGR
jgi:hypothetical protein